MRIVCTKKMKVRMPNRDSIICSAFSKLYALGAWPLKSPCQMPACAAPAAGLHELALCNFGCWQSQAACVWIYVEG